MINMKDQKINLMMKDKDGKIMSIANMTDQNKSGKERKNHLKISLKMLIKEQKKKLKEKKRNWRSKQKKY